MPARARKEVFAPDEVGVYHCYSRVVRQLYLCGKDARSGKDYSYRMDWIEDRVRELQSIFMIDVFATAFLDNHFHTMLRNRPDLVKKASDKEIAQRIWRLFPKRREADGTPAAPTDEEIQRIIDKPDEIDKWRERLSSISWYMWCLKWPIACRANAEVGAKGSFWDGRFESVRLLDEMAVLMCSVYIDLNEIRAGKAESLPEATHSSIFHRLKAGQAYLVKHDQKRSDILEGHPERWEEEPAPEWLSPINDASRSNGRNLTLEEEEPQFGQARPSNSGFLPTTLTQYVQICDWIGRQEAKGKRGMIPDDVPPILESLTTKVDSFVDTTLAFNKRFKWYAGSPENIIEQRKAKGLTRMHGVANARAVYPTSDS